MSTEHQQYSTENQHAAIQRYADEHGLLIVRTFTDAGKSGVGIQGRDALQELLRIVNSGAADFATILVYDVSRWGRFQDADEAAHYEFQCKRRKITVQYCAEHFPNDTSPMSAVIKSLKRAMAGEYSRELSTKVFAGQCRLITLGDRQRRHGRLRSAAAPPGAKRPAQDYPSQGRTQEPPNRTRHPRPWARP